MNKVWFITGASRGIGFELAKAALASGDRVVATARKSAALAASLGGDEGNLLALPLDVSDKAAIGEAVQAAIGRFGRIDVLVNNAGYGQLGLFEECDEARVRRQFEVNVFGLFDVTRAVLPQMRRQRSGVIFNLSSTAGVRGLAGGSLYCASKFAVEGFSESLALEVAQFGIRVVIVRPGPFRTDFLDPSSVDYGDQSIDDYAQSSASLRAEMGGRNHLQAGDPARLGAALVELAGRSDAPLRFAAGSNALGVVADKIALLASELEAWRPLSASTDGDY